MEHIIINFTQVLVAGALAFFSMKYWKRNLNNQFKLDTSNLAYTLFTVTQILAVFTILFFSIDEQILAYLEGLSVFGQNAGALWAFVGIQVLTSIVTYVLINMIAHLMFTIIHPTENGLHAEIESNHWYSILIYGVIFIGLTVIASSFVLRPALFEWIANDVSLKPLY